MYRQHTSVRSNLNVLQKCFYFLYLIIPLAILINAILSFRNGKSSKEEFIGEVIIGVALFCLLLAFGIYSVCNQIKENKRVLSDRGQPVGHGRNFVNATDHTFRHDVNGNNIYDFDHNEIARAQLASLNDRALIRTFIDENQNGNTIDEQKGMLKNVIKSVVTNSSDIDFIDKIGSFVGNQSFEINKEFKNIEGKLLKLRNALKANRVDADFEITTKAYSEMEIIRGNKINNDTFKLIVLEAIAECVIEKFNELKNNKSFIGNFFDEQNVKDFFDRDKFGQNIALKLGMPVRAPDPIAPEVRVTDSTTLNMTDAQRARLARERTNFGANNGKT